jgi:hypothetical protein
VSKAWWTAARFATLVECERELIVDIEVLLAEMRSVAIPDADDMERYRVLFWFPPCAWWLSDVPPSGYDVTGS